MNGMSHFSHYRTFVMNNISYSHQDNATEENTMKQITGVYTAPRPIGWRWISGSFTLSYRHMRSS